MNHLSNSSFLILVGLMFILGACGKSAYSTFSKPGEPYRSAQEIAELKKTERQQRRLAIQSGLLNREEKKKIAQNNRVRRTRNLGVLPSKEIETVISTARSYRGTPYKFGGTTRIGMDCSGLLCTSFMAINVQLPRTSSEQSEFGVPVPTRKLQAGDLVFFSSTRSTNNITHVGMVTDVKDEKEIYFIHASTTLGVTEDNLFAPYYQKIFVKAVRPNI
ncbi:C40 family peptidase [Rufibacter roseus]|uniref:C40 family peptidase n=1 Tax=Rufibacter roseus TaxID=1567108 RepID=A0ABW2DM90_9BACT|nr:C40 family peptidase [Rufibacter roseus]